jgi:hypothetical protein
MRGHVLGRTTPSATARPGGGRTLPTCPSEPSTTPPWAGRSPPPMARSTGPRCSSRSPFPPTGG